MKKIFFIALILLNLNANDKLLTQKLRNGFELKEQQIKKQSEMLSNSWIDPVILSVQRSKNKHDNLDENRVDFGINLRQDIFRSGGIFHAISYSKIKKELGLKNLKKQKNEQIIAIYSLLIEILINDKMQEQSNLNIKNAKLEIKSKQEQYEAGLVDISVLNDAILKKITHENTLIGLKTTKNDLIYNFKDLSDKAYESIVLPKLNIPSQHEYIKKNLSLIVAKLKSKNDKYLYKLTNSSYLPKVTLNASYHHVKLDDKNTNLSNLGLGISVPLDIKVFDDVQRSKLTYLISANEYSLMMDSQKKYYDKILQDIGFIYEKIKLAKQNLNIYESLQKQTSELVNAKLKIKDDLSIIKNSKSIHELQLGIYELQKQKKTLQLYKNFVADKI